MARGVIEASRLTFASIRHEQVEELIQRAKDEWEEIWEDEEERDEDGKPLWKPDKMPLPLVRLRVSEGVVRGFFPLGTVTR